MNNIFYPNTSVLKNKLNIKDNKRLNAIESQIVMHKKTIIDQVMNISHGNDFNMERLKDIHHFLFDDIYDWAGTFRTNDIYRTEEVLGGKTMSFTESNQIEKQLLQIMKYYNSPRWNYQDISDEVKLHGWMELLSNLFQVHMFNEGNTYTSVAFALQFADKVGLQLNKEYFFENSKYLRDCLCLYCNGEGTNLMSFVSQAFQQEASPNLLELKSNIFEKMTIPEINKTFDSWLQEYNNPIINNYIHVNMRKVIAAMQEESYSSMELIKEKFMTVVDDLLDHDFRNEQFNEIEDNELE